MSAPEGHVNVVTWALQNVQRIEAVLVTSGAVLLRGFSIPDADQFFKLMEAVGGPPQDYRFGSTPRNRTRAGVYTASEYPADQTIFLHNEMSYTTQWPSKLWFLCVRPADEGGETPLADSRRILSRLPPDLVERFQISGVRYVRVFSPGLDVPWSQAFETSSRKEIEQFCVTHGIAFEWRGREGLVTTQVCQAVVRHPRTNETVWFNQAHLFHPASLPEDVRDVMEKSLGTENLPRQVTYGDGTPIADQVIDEIRRAYDAETTSFPWMANDLLVIDNLLVAHGRRPYKGQRKVLVGMTD